MGAGISSNQAAAGIALAGLRVPGAAAVSQTAWASDLVIGGGWSAATETPAYRRDTAGNVFLRGAVSGGAAASTPTTLPEGFRPAVKESHAVAGTDSTGPTSGSCVITIGTDGVITVDQVVAGGGTSVVRFDGVQFSTVA